MAIGKAMVVFMVFLIAGVAMVTIFSVGNHDKSTDSYYKDVNNTINQTEKLTGQITSTGTGYMTPLILVAAIMFFGAVIMIYRKK